jgi:PAS domain S-box-containing protein
MDGKPNKTNPPPGQGVTLTHIAAATQSAPQSSWARISIALAAFAVYGLAFRPLSGLLGSSAAALSALPVLAAGWLLGTGGGLLAGVLTIPLNTFLLNLAGYPGWDVLVRQGGAPGRLALILIGLAVGRLHDLSERLTLELARRQQAESLLQENEARLRATLANAPIVLWALDRNGVFTLSEGKGLAALGRKPGQAVGQSVFDLYREVPEILEGSRRALAGEAFTSRVEVRGVTFESYHSPVRTPDGEIVGAIGVATDITESRRVEDALRESEARYRGLFEESPISLWEEDFSEVKQRLEALRRHGVTDFRAYLQSQPAVVADCARLVKITNVNHATLKLFRATSQAELFHNLDLVFSEESYGDFVEELVNIAEGRTEFRWEGINRTLAGNRLNVSLAWSAVPGYEGSLSRVIISLMDITERKQAEAQRDRQAGELAVLYRASGHLLGDIRALVCVPLIVQEQTSGVLLVGRKTDFTKPEVSLLTAIADMAANALHRATLHEQTEQHLQRLAALHTIDAAINASLDSRVTLDVLLDQVITQLQVDAAAILLLNPLTQVLDYAAGRGFRNPATQHTQQRLGEGETGRAALERRIIAIPDLRESPKARARTGLLIAEGFVSYYAVPLIAKGQVKGVLEIYQRTPLSADPEWLDFLRTLAEQAAIAVDNALLFDSLQRSTQDLSLAYDATIEGWSRALGLRDKETEGYTQRVTEITERLARAMGVSDAHLIHIRRGALLHDIGKMGVPDSILLKPGGCRMRNGVSCASTPRMPMTCYRRSPTCGWRSIFPFCHHEKWDGTGYPQGLQGERIPLAARLFAVVDVWDAPRSDRPYRPAWSAKTVREYIREQTGRHFDPKVVAAFWALGLGDE